MHHTTTTHNTRANLFQEMVTIHIFERKFGLFVTLLQFGGYTFFAFLQWLSRETKHSSLPIAYCVSLAVLQASMQGLSNLSIKYLNYPAKVGRRAPLPPGRPPTPAVTVAPRAPWPQQQHCFPRCSSRARASFRPCCLESFSTGRGTGCRSMPSWASSCWGSSFSWGPTRRRAPILIQLGWC